MKVLIVCKDHPEFATHVKPFITEQADALIQQGCIVDYYVKRGGYIFPIGLIKKIKTLRPDIIHAHYGLYAVPAIIANIFVGKKYRAKVAVTFHNGETASRFVNFISSLFSLFADHVIYVEQHIRDMLYFKAKDYSILPCGVNLEDCAIIPFEEARKQMHCDNDKKYILFGGGFDDLRKNYPLLKQALETMLAEKGHFLSDGSEQIGNVICWQIDRLSRQEVTLRMCASDLFVMPTHSEGSPQSLKEAMACNCPILSTDVADIKLLLGDLDGHYLLHNPLNTNQYWKEDENTLDETILFLKQGLSFSGRTNARERIVQLGLTNIQVVQKLIKIYNSIMDNK